MMTLTLVFHKCGTSQLRSLISALAEDGGALGEPTVTEHLHETHVTARFGPMAGMREVSRFVAAWSDSQPDIDYVGVREVP